MKQALLTSCATLIAVAVTPALAQTSPASAIGEMAPHTDSTGDFAGYVPSARPGMVVGGGSPGEGAAEDDAVSPGDGLPEITDGRALSAEKIEGFNEAIEQNFPMTPEMIRRYRDIYENTERALSDRAEPEARVDAGFISLEPGETPSEISVAPGIASVLGFYDMTGQPWPIEQYVLGSGEDFQAVQLGQSSNNIAITPLKRFGWSNLVVVLKDQPKPVVMRVGISTETAHYRHDVQVMAAGPNATRNTAASDRVLTEAGSGLLLAALSGVDLPSSARPVDIVGVDARAWVVGERLFVRSRHALLSPSWAASMSGPDGIRVYEIKPGPVALFSVDGTIVRADVVLP